MQLQNKVLLLHHQNVIELWCNGNTTDSGPVILGSNPGSSTRKTAPKSGAVFCWERFTTASGSGAVFCWEGSCPLRVPGRFFVGKIHGRFGFRGGFFVGKAHGRFRLRGGFLLEKLTAASGFGTFPALEKPRPYRTAAHIAHIPPPRTIIPNNPSPKKSGPARRLEPLVTFRNPVVSGPESIFRDPSSRSAPGFRVCGRGNAHRAPWDAPCRPFREYSPGTTQLPPD